LRLLPLRKLAVQTLAGTGEGRAGIYTALRVEFVLCEKSLAGVGMEGGGYDNNDIDSSAWEAEGLLWGVALGDESCRPLKKLSYVLEESLLPR
jgi:hypothetical protein